MCLSALHSTTALHPGQLNETPISRTHRPPDPGLLSGRRWREGGGTERPAAEQGFQAACAPSNTVQRGGSLLCDEFFPFRPLIRAAPCLWGKRRPHTTSPGDLNATDPGSGEAELLSQQLLPVAPASVPSSLHGGLSACLGRRSCVLGQHRVATAGVGVRHRLHRACSHQPSPAGRMVAREGGPRGELPLVLRALPARMGVGGPRSPPSRCGNRLRFRCCVRSLVSCSLHLYPAVFLPSCW